MNGGVRFGPWTAALLVFVALAGLGAAWSIDRNSLERANRLYRGGVVGEAAIIYAEHLGRNPEKAAADRIRYNLGTALLGLDDAGASEALAGVGPDAGVEVQVRALNNLGLWRLVEAARAVGRGRARAHAVGAIDAYRAALRLQPGRPDTGWNLAIALRMLASIDAGDYGNGELVEGGAKGEGDESSGDDPDAAGEDEGPQAGEGETVAQGDEDAPLSPDVAARILGTAHRDPTTMVGKLMAFEGRTLRQSASERTSPSRAE